MIARRHLWPLLRWLLLPLLFFLLGQYLEGVAYRVFVRDVPFVFAVYAVAFLAGQFLRQIRAPSRWLTPLQTLLAPSLFILSVQQYYNGSINVSALPALMVCSLPMGLNLLLYINSLFNWTYRESIPEHETPLADIDYKIELIHLSHEGKQVGMTFSDAGNNPPPQLIAVDGFSANHAIDLMGYWSAMEQNQLEQFETTVTLRETIVKFGETQQLVDNYLLRLMLYL